jgi:hypothetical protein
VRIDRYPITRHQILMEGSEPVNQPAIYFEAQDTVTEDTMPISTKFHQKPLKVFIRCYNKGSLIFAAVLLILFLILLFVVQHAKFPVGLDSSPPAHMMGSNIIKEPNLYGEISTKPSNGRYAACISGNDGELLLQDRFWANLVANVFTNQTDLFIYLETGIPTMHGPRLTAMKIKVFDISRLKKIYEPWLRSFVVTTRNLDKEVEFYNRLATKSAGSFAGYNRSLRRFIKVSNSYSLLQSYEFMKDSEYELIVQMRPDVLFPFPIDYPRLDKQDVLYTILGYPSDTPRDDGLYLLTGAGLGMGDFAFIGSSMISRTLAQFLPMELSSLENFPDAASYPEYLLKWLVVDRLQMKTKPTDLQTPLWGKIPSPWCPDPINDPFC